MDRNDTIKYNKRLAQYDRNFEYYHYLLMVIIILIIIIIILSVTKIVPKWANSITVLSFLFVGIILKPVHPNDKYR